MSEKNILDVLAAEAEQAESVAAPPEIPVSEGESGADLSFTVKRFVFQILLEKASSVVPVKEIAPVLKNYQVEITPSSIRVIATDMELSILSFTEMVSATGTGTVFFPAKRLLSILREASDGDVMVVIKDGVANIRIGHTSWDLKLANGADYPYMPDVADLTFHQVDRPGFLSAIAAVRYAAAKDATRPHLMLLDFSKGKVTACDGSRFQQAPFEFPLDVQIPVGAVDDLVRLLRATELESVGVAEHANYLAFRVGSDVFLANKMPVTFPDMEEVILRPALENQDILTVDRSDLLDAIKRVRINTDPETGAIGLRVAPGKLTVMSRDRDHNGAEEEISCGWEGPERMVVVNHTFLSDMLGMYSQVTCTFRLGPDTKSKKSPLFLQDTETGASGVIQRMHAGMVGYGDE